MAANQSPEPSGLGGTGDVQVTLSAAHSTTSWDERETSPTHFDLPVLFLHRERGAASEADRTLRVSVMGSGGGEFEIEIISHHTDVSTDESFAETRRLMTADRTCSIAAPCTLEWTFDPSTTPSDLYYLRVKDQAGNVLWENPDRPAFAMLDTWDVTFGDYAVRLTYATLFPFSSRLSERTLCC